MAAKILIVDDEVYMRRLIRQTLEDLEDRGVEVLIAEDGRAALETIKQERPQLVLLDVMLPLIDGFEVCYIVKRELGMDEVKVIILTAKGQEFDRQRGEQVGAYLYMTKPFDPDELLNTATQALGL